MDTVAAVRPSRGYAQAPGSAAPDPSLNANWVPNEYAGGQLAQCRERRLNSKPAKMVIRAANVANVPTIR